MPTVRQIKTLVAYRKIGDLVVPHRQSQCHPVVERRVFHLVMPKFPLLIGNRAMADFPSPAFGQGYPKRAGT